MARRKKTGRDLTGILIVDKPSGISSNRVLQTVKRLYQANKAGHTGTLDPLASGVLPVCLGEATKLSTYLLNADKCYQVTCRLGIATDTGDSDGDVINEQTVPEFDAAALQPLLTQFTGPQSQIPPMFSALKYNGQPLYKLARKGIEVKRKPRKISIYAMQLLGFDKNSFTLEVHCSKGTYIRTLVQDIAAALGSCGHVTMLRRTRAAGYALDQSIGLAHLEQLADLQALDSHLQDAFDALPDWPAIKLDTAQTRQLYFGQPLQSQPIGTVADVRLLTEETEFVGLGQIDAVGEITAKRLFVRQNS